MTHEEIIKLGSLVNIEVSDAEARELMPNMESILGYIDQIQQVDADMEDVLVLTEPILREDIPNPVLNFSDDFLALVPEKQDGYVKVPKVLDK